MEKVIIGGGEIAVEWQHHYPDRPTIVFLHDSLGCIELWRNFPGRLGNLTQCNVFIYDRHGYGRSGPLVVTERGADYMEKEAEILNSILEVYNLSNAILFGHSDGGTIALIAAAKHPERVSAIITVGAHIFVEDETLAGIRDAIELYQSTDLHRRLQKYHGEKTEAMFWAWAKTWTSEEYRSWNITHLLPSVKCPVLVIQGEQDEYGTIAQVNGIVDQVQGPALELILPGIKHTPHKEDPENVLKHSAGFIQNVLAI